MESTLISTSEILRRVKVRKGRSGDYQFCYRLTKRNMEHYFKVHWGGWKKREYCRHYNPKCMWVFYFNGKRFGYLSYKAEDKSAHLTNVQLSSRFRNRGIGQKMMTQSELALVKGGISRVTLTVFEENPAVRLYKRMGYRQVENRNGTLKLEKHFE